MKNKEWNPKDWQGRRKHQVENGYKIMGVSLTIILGFFLLYGMFSLVNYVLG